MDVGLTLKSTSVSPTASQHRSALGVMSPRMWSLLSRCPLSLSQRFISPQPKEPTQRAIALRTSGRRTGHKLQYRVSALDRN